MHKKFHFYLNFNLQYWTCGAIIYPVHGSTGSVTGSKGGGSSGFLQLVRIWVRGLDIQAGFGRTDEKLGVGGEFFFGRSFARKRPSRAARHRAGGMYPTAEPVFPGPRVSPRAGGPFRDFRKGGPGSRRIITGATPDWFVPLRRKGNFSSGALREETFGPGATSGKWGYPSFQWEWERPPRLEYPSLRWAPQPLRGRRSPQQVSLISLGMR